MFISKQQPCLHRSTALIKLLRDWLSRLPIWREEKQNTKAEIFYAALFIIVLVIVGAVWQKAQAQDLSHDQSHGWQSEYAASSSQPELKWAVPVQVRVYGEDDIQKELEYAIWSWGQRTGHDISYGGQIEAIATGESRTITVRLIDALEMQAITKSFSTKGTTDFWYYTASGIMTGAVINLNSLYFPRDQDTGKVIVDRCALQTIVHELGHALGSRHTNESDDVMYPYSARGCRYSLSSNDIASTHYEGSECFIELTMENDLYLPDIHGKRVSLKKLEGNIWKIESMADNAENTCHSANTDEFLNLTMLDIRAPQARYWAKFKFIGNDQWELQYAE